jgi:hypothetical protein
MKIKGVLLAAILTAVLCICGNVFAALSGSGTETNPYLIQSRSDFDWFAANSSYWATGVYTKLMTDIDLIGSFYTGAVIADNPRIPYRGIFDGNGQTIKNLTINDSGDYAGLFGYVQEGQIKDTILENANIRGQVYVGGLVGYKAGGIITYCQVEGFISGSRLVGGIAGYGSRIYDSCSFGSVNCDNDKAGGLVGMFSDLVIKNCYSTSRVTGVSEIGG